jgi:FixJ family two-component response regulator
VDSNEATVFIIDDDAGVRAALSRLLRSVGWNAVTYAAAHGFLDDVSTDTHGCILLDVSMPGMSGPELHARIRERGFRMPVIYLTGQCTVSIGVHAMKQGALDFLEKPIDADTLLPVIDTAIALDLRRRTEDGRSREVDQRLAGLSGREREVLNHVIAGRLNKQIASDLGIAEKTVKVHRGRMMAKMHVRSVAELVHVCDAKGIGA